MLGQTAAILDAVSRPDLREDDPAPGRERFYRRDLDHRRWLRVVVDFDESPAFVVTAFVPDNAPETTP
jgi:primosomal protein N''